MQSLEGEVKSFARDESDMEKYFKESITSFKASGKSERVNDESKTKSNVPLNDLTDVKEKSNHGASKKKESKTKSTSYTKKKQLLWPTGKENLRTRKNDTVPAGKSGSRPANGVSNKSGKSGPINNSKSTTKLDVSEGKSNLEESGGSKLSSIGPLSSEESMQTCSVVCTQERCKLSSWGLPPNILEKYEARGVSTMFPWQVECLSNHKVIEEKRNLVYSAPTSAGKTLVAEILIVKTVLESRKKAIFILPFVSVVREKMYYFQDLLSDSGIRVEGFMGGVAPPGGFAATHVAIATIEKANSLVNRLMEEDELASLGAVVVDELHLVGDPNRGYLLELLLTKLKYMSLRDQHVHIQLIGMSATLPNLSLLADWLDAELYKTEFRPVPLNEQCKIGGSIYDNKLNLIRTLDQMPGLSTDTDNVLQLCIETISDGHSVLIFCSTKNWCEKLAEQIAMAFFKLGQEDTKLGEMLRKQLDPTLISETLEQLKRSPTGLDSVLKNTVSFGTAFHHAGLTMDERDIIEGSFRSGSLRVLVATSTLSSGVNLPARRVIIRSPIFGGKVLDSLTYKQMIGRAGRMGKDTAGESILMCKAHERKAGESLLSSTLNPIESCLEDSAPLIRALLEAIASEVVFTPSDLELYTKCTLLSLTEEDGSVNPAEEAIKFLVKNEFLLLQKTEEGQRWVATALGKACLAASVPPKEALFLFEELQKARRCFVLDTELHVIYLVTPLNAGNLIPGIDWLTYLELWKGLSESERRVGQLVGVEERYLMSATRGIARPGKLLHIHKRFFTALALHDLVRETPLPVVCKKYSCCRGVLQSLQQSAATFAGMITQFCRQLGWDCMELLVSQFQTRLQFGVCRELLDLLRLPMLNGLRARSLYKQGITSIAELAVANELDVERALHKALPFESEREHEGEHESEALQRKKMRTVFVTGKDGLTPYEAAMMLVQEARRLVQNELGLKNVPWNSNESSVSNESSSLRSQNTSVSTKGANTKSNLDPSINCTSNEAQNAQTENEEEPSDVKRTTMEPVGEENKSTVEESKSDHSELNLNVMESFKVSDLDSQKDLMEDEHLETVKPTDQTRQLNVSEIADSPFQKCSIDFFEVPVSMLRDSVDKANKSSSLVSSSDNPEEAVASKRSRTDLNEKSGLLNRLSIGISTDPRPSRSPSLFDDSLNLDTQIYNVLDENIIDTLQLSKFESFKSTESNSRNLGSTNKRITQERTNKTPSSSISLQTRQVLLSWKDDSWNEPRGLIERLRNLDENVTEQTPTKIEIRHTRNIAQRTPTTASSSLQTIKPLSARSNLQRSVFKEASVETTPKPKDSSVENPRRSLNKSDMDDVVVASQTIETPVSNLRLRAKLDSERRLRANTQKPVGTNLQEKPEITPRLGPKRIETLQGLDQRFKQRNLKQKFKESMDSIESITDDDTPVKCATKSLAKSTIGLKKRRTDPEICTETEQSTNWSTLNIVKVGCDRGTFNLFRREAMSKKYISIALNCEHHTNESQAIGSRILGSEKKKRPKRESFVFEDRKLSGAAISWENNIAYYVYFVNTDELKISGKEQLKLFKELLSNPLLYVKCFATKETFRTLYQCCGIAPACRFLDPKVAYWLHESSIYEKSFNEMVVDYFPQGSLIMKRIGSCYGTGPGLDTKSSLPGEFRASAEVVLTWHVTDVLLNKLEAQSPTLLYTFKEVEMRTVSLLACMELNGLGVSLKSLKDLSIVIREEMASLEDRAYTLAGRRFNFSSSKEVGEVLGLYKGKKISVNKAVLEQTDHPISNLVMSWRKLNGTQTKIVNPLLILAQNEPRVHGSCVTCTVTGRISMHEPNLQNVPKDFNSVDNSYAISVRMAFMPAIGNVILSADYCQLELRILAHFSRDPTLCEIMRTPGDIFKNIAAKWNHVTEEEVDEKMRQQTKQLCYGMIYGMGVRSLAEALSVDEARAKEFMESFMNAYPGIKLWLEKVLEDARRTGYVATLLERRRDLPALNSTVSSEKSQAERQAVNTKVQGSAADIAKKAMVNVEDRIRYEFPNSPAIMPDVQGKRKLRSSSREAQLRGGYLILQLHDELLYEVNASDLQQVARIVKESMEQVCQLSVPLPVKIRVGPAWGDLTEYDCK